MADAYVVVFAALMVPAGMLGDRFGRRLMLITGLGIFLAGSLAGALVEDIDAVIIARAVMGVGAALVTPLTLSVLPALFAPQERTKAVGMPAFAALLGSRTTVDSGYGFTALWLSVSGLGFGFSVIPAMSGALGTLPRDRAGWGSPHAFKAVGEGRAC